MKAFKEIKPTEIHGNPIHLIGQQWMLITAGTPEHFNTMTASWGSLGELWSKPVCFCFVRPQRYTYEFMERNDAFTLSFFAENYKPQLNFCGSHSGREADKVGECGFTVRKAANGSVFFDEARLVLECRKIYFQDLDPARFLDESIMRNYPQKDFHRMYIGKSRASSCPDKNLRSQNGTSEEHQGHGYMPEPKTSSDPSKRRCGSAAPF